MQLLNWTTIFLLCIFIKNIPAPSIEGDENGMLNDTKSAEMGTNKTETTDGGNKNTGKEEDDKENGPAGVNNDDDDDDKPPTSESNVGIGTDETETDDENKHIGNDELMARGSTDEDDDVGDGNVGNRGVTEANDDEERNEPVEDKMEEMDDEEEVVKGRANGEEGGFSQMEEPRTVGENNEFGGTFGEETERNLDSDVKNHEFGGGDEEFAGNRMDEMDGIVPPEYSTSESESDNEEQVDEVQKVHSAGENVQGAHHSHSEKQDGHHGHDENKHHNGKDEKDHKKGEGDHHEDHHKKDEKHKKLAGEGNKSSKKLEGSNSSKNLLGEVHGNVEGNIKQLEKVASELGAEAKEAAAQKHKPVAAQLNKAKAAVEDAEKKEKQGGHENDVQADLDKVKGILHTAEGKVKKDKKLEGKLKNTEGEIKHLKTELAQHHDGAAGGSGQTLLGVQKELTNLEPNLKKHETEAEKQHDKKAAEDIKEADKNVKVAETDLQTGKFKEAEKALEKAKGELNEAEHSEQALHTKEGTKLVTKLEGGKKVVENAETEIKKAEQSGGGKQKAEIEKGLSDAGKKLEIVEHEAETKKLGIVAKDAKKADAAVAEAQNALKTNAEPGKVAKQVTFAKEKVVEGIAAANKANNGQEVVKKLDTVKDILNNIIKALKGGFGKGWEAAVGAFKSLKDKVSKHVPGLLGGGSKTTHDNAKHNDAAGKVKNKVHGGDGKHKEADGKGSTHGHDGKHAPNAHHRK